MEEETVEISKTLYEQLVKDSYYLFRLFGGGVDNWEWFSESRPSEKELKAVLHNDNLFWIRSEHDL